MGFTEESMKFWRISYEVPIAYSGFNAANRRKSVGENEYPCNQSICYIWCIVFVYFYVNYSKFSWINFFCLQ